MFNLKQYKINRILKKLKVMQQSRINNQPTDEVIKREIALYFNLTEIYRKLVGNKKFPYASILLVEALKAAADLESAEAHFQVGEILLNEGIFRQNLQNEGVLKSKSNLRYCSQAFEEAHAHLLTAEKLGSIAGKRLRGLSIINGWGVHADKNAGFELVVASIEQEGSWDKVPQIFAAIGLNKPEFFAAIMQRRK